MTSFATSDVDHATSVQFQERVNNQQISPLARTIGSARNFIELMNKRDVAGLVSLLSEDIAFKDHGIEVAFADIPSVQSFLERLFTAFPDALRTVEAVYEHESGSVVQWRCDASHSEPFLFGKMRTIQAHFAGVTVLTSGDDGITCVEEYYDQSSSRRHAFSCTFRDYVEY